MPLAASAQSQPGAQVGVVTAPAPRTVDLNAVPQASAPHTGAVRALPRPRTMLTEEQYQALKDEAARRRFDMRGLRPMPPPANLPSGPANGAP